MYKFQPTAVKSDLDNTNFTNDYFNKSVMAPLLRQFDTSISPRINDAAASTGSTFSTRTQVAKSQALQDLNTQATAQLASAARQDNIEKSQQDLAAQQFNVDQAQQTAQYGAGLQGQLDTTSAQQNTARGAANQANKLAYDTLNTNTQVGLSEAAANRQLQGVQLQQDVLNAPLNRMTAESGIASQIQQVKQQAVDRTNAEAQRMMPENNPYIKLMMAFLNRDPNAIAGPSSASQIGSAVGTGASALTGAVALQNLMGGGAAAGAGAGAAGSGAGLATGASATDSFGALLPLAAAAK